MKKTLLYLSGIAIAGGALYYYFKSQFDLALQYEYKIDDLRILKLTDQGMEVEATVRLNNKSAFKVEVLEYDIAVRYKNITVARAISTETFVVNPESSTNLKIFGSVVFGEAKSAILPFVSSVLSQKPIKIDVAGYVRAKFLGITHTFEFDAKDLEYSSNLLADFNLKDGWEKLREKFSILKKI